MCWNNGSIKIFKQFWRALEMSLINCNINLILTWWANYLIVSTDVVNEGATFAMTETKLYIPVVT